MSNPPNQAVAQEQKPNIDPASTSLEILRGEQTFAETVNQIDSMLPYLDPNTRLSLSVYAFTASEPEEVDDYPIYEPAVQMATLVNYFGPDRVESRQEALLKAIRGTLGEAEYERYVENIREHAEQDIRDDDETTESIVIWQLGEDFQAVIDMFQRKAQTALHHTIKVSWERADTPQTRSAVSARDLEVPRFFAKPKQPLAIGKVALELVTDIYALELVAVKDAWQPTIDETLAALDSGRHVVVSAPRNSGKTHYYATSLTDQLKGDYPVHAFLDIEPGLNILGRPSESLAVALKAGDQAGLNTLMDVANLREQGGESLKNSVVIVDEVQGLVLDTEHLPSALKRLLVDRRSLGVFINASISAPDQARVVADLEAEFEGKIEVLGHPDSWRPEYPTEVLGQILEYSSVGESLKNWWLNDPIAHPLRTLRSVYMLYDLLLSSDSLQEVLGHPLQTPADLARDLDTPVRKLSPVVKGISPNQRLIDRLQLCAAGSGMEMMALAKSLGIEPPRLGLIYPEMDPAPGVADFL